MADNEDNFEIKFSIWSMTLPKAIFSECPNFSDFLAGHISSSELILSQHLKNVLVCFHFQGCLIDDSADESYSLHDTKVLLTAFINYNYGYYYSHRLWEQMRGDQIPLALLKQWWARTYYLSRYAGITAAAACVNAPNDLISKIFLKSTLEEYAHCQEYYLPPQALFESVPSSSASFSAFDYQMLEIAKTNWLAHVFVALFQERTAQFKKNANVLYDRIEHQLRMPGILEGWRRHISYDEFNSHANDLLQLLNQDMLVNSNDLQESFDEASLTVELLVDGLNTVHSLGMNNHTPRLELDNTTITKSNVAGIAFFHNLENHLIQSTNFEGVIVEVIGLGCSLREEPDSVVQLKEFFTEFECVIVATTAKCLENCKSQGEIIAIGRVLESLSKAGFVNHPKPNARERKSRIMWNFLTHLCAKNPDTYLHFVIFSMEIYNKHLSSENLLFASFYNILKNSDFMIASKVALSDVKPVETTKLVITFIEFLEFFHIKSTSFKNRFFISRSMMP